MNSENKQDFQWFKDESKLVNYRSYQQPGLSVGVGQQDVDDELAEAGQGGQHYQGQALSDR